MSLSNKQTEFINRNFDRTLDVAEGTPRSGKTTACILRFYDFLNTSRQQFFSCWSITAAGVSVGHGWGRKWFDASVWETGPH